MKSLLYILFFLQIVFFSCSSDKPDILAFKSGLYGSKEGNFVAKFPDKPQVLVQHNKIGNIEFDQVLFHYKLGIEHIYSVSYADYPEHLLKTFDIEQLFDQSMKTIAGQIESFQVANREILEEEKYDKVIIYTLNSTHPKSNTYMKAKLLKYEDRIYMISFAALRRMPNPDVIDDFLNSFEIYNNI